MQVLFIRLQEQASRGSMSLQVGWLADNALCGSASHIRSGVVARTNATESSSNDK